MRGQKIEHLSVCKMLQEEICLHFIHMTLFTLNLTNDCSPFRQSDPSFKTKFVAHVTGVLDVTKGKAQFNYSWLSEWMTGEG